VAVVVLGLALVPSYAETGAAVAAVGGNFGVWISSYALARSRKVETPPLQLAAKPLLLAAALAICTGLVALPAWAEALGALFLFALLAPILDRALFGDILHLSHASASTGDGAQ
jgi:O-antigen/teichoic acid export membrane protein